jgi:hypothetical protein
MSSQSESESADRDSAASNDGSQLDTAGQAILKLLHKGLVSLKPIADMG